MRKRKILKQALPFIILFAALVLIMIAVTIPAHHH